MEEMERNIAAMAAESTSNGKKPTRAIALTLNSPSPK